MATDVGYTGAVVVGRSDRPLVEQDALQQFGYRHYWLRKLGDGWQLVETGGVDDPSDLTGATQALSAATGHPALGAYILDSDCATLSLGTGPLLHLKDVDQPCPVYRHRPEPPVRTIEDAVAELSAWSTTAGLSADAATLHDRLAQDHGVADDLVFDLVKALGVERIGRTEPWSFPVDGVPFGSVSGLATRARYRAVDREDGEVPQPWEEPALALEQDLWASLYRPDVDVPAFVRRTAELLAEYLTYDARPSNPYRKHADFYAPFLDGTRPPADTSTSDRSWADRRATDGS
jgi:hypothetical protein